MKKVFKNRKEFLEIWEAYVAGLEPLESVIDRINNKANEVHGNRLAFKVRLALHNIFGHPLMEIAYIFGFRRLGNWIHNKLFYIDHE